jgi:urea transport system permease protein
MLRLLVLLAALWCGAAWAVPSALHAIAAGEDNDARIAALKAALDAPSSELAPFLQALLDGEVRVKGNQAWLASEAPLEAEEPSLNNRLRRELGAALAALNLRAAEPAQRRAALAVLRDEPESAPLALLEQAFEKETDAELKTQLDDLLAAVRPGCPGAPPPPRNSPPRPSPPSAPCCWSAWAASPTPR